MTNILIAKYIYQLIWNARISNDWNHVLSGVFAYVFAICFKKIVLSLWYMFQSRSMAKHILFALWLKMKHNITSLCISYLYQESQVDPYHFFTKSRPYVCRPIVVKLFFPQPLNSCSIVQTPLSLNPLSIGIFVLLMLFIRVFCSSAFCSLLPHAPSSPAFASVYSLLSWHFHLHIFFLQPSNFVLCSLAFSHYMFRFLIISMHLFCFRVFCPNCMFFALWLTSLLSVLLAFLLSRIWTLLPFAPRLFCKHMTVSCPWPISPIAPCLIAPLPFFIYYSSKLTAQCSK